MKKCAQKNCRKMFLEAIFFRIREIFFQSFGTKFLSLLHMISLAYKISHFLSVNHYPELRCVICTGVTLLALVLHCSALSQSESSFFYVYYYDSIKSVHVVLINKIQLPARAGHFCQPLNSNDIDL